MIEVQFSWKSSLDLSLLLASWSAAFGRKIDINVLEWWFSTGKYFAESLAAYIIEDGVIACFYAISPRIILNPKGERKKAGLMNIGFTHPKFQGKGYYLLVNNAMHEELRSMGFACIFGFANHNSHYSYRKYLGWHDLSTVNNFRLNLATTNLIKTYAGDCNCLEFVPTSSDLEAFADSVVSQEVYHVERSKDFLNWRLLASPLESYRFLKISSNGSIIGFAIFKVWNNLEMDIMEVFYSDNRFINNQQFFLTIFDKAHELGFSSINMWSNLHSEEHLLLERLGFREDKFSAYYGIINFTEEFIIDDVRNWHFRFLDSDVY